MPPKLLPLPDDALDGKVRLTLGFALAELLPLIAMFGWLGIMAGYIETPMPPTALEKLGPPIALACLAAMGIAPMSLMVTAASVVNFKRRLRRLGEEDAVRRALLDGLRRELRDRGGPSLRALLGVGAEAWAAADGEIALALMPAPLAHRPGVGEDADDVYLEVSTRRGRPKVNVVWRLRRDDEGRWRIVSQMAAADFLRGALHLDPQARLRL